MSNSLKRLSTFFSELKRRKVYQVTAVYLVLAVAGMEFLDVLIPSTQLPQWASPFFLALAIIGLPVVAVLAWTFDQAHRESTGGEHVSQRRGWRPITADDDLARRKGLGGQARQGFSHDDRGERALVRVGCDQYPQWSIGQHVRQVDDQRRGDRRPPARWDRPRPDRSAAWCAG